MAVDFSAVSTGLRPEPVRESAVDKSGAILGQGLAEASQVRARGIFSEAQAAQNFGQVAPALSESVVNATVGFQKAQLDKKINQEIQNFVDSKKDPQENLIGFATAGVLEESARDIWDKLGKGEISSENFVETVNASNAKINKLVKTYEQGLMQPSELVNRIMAITREEIARNPGLTDELFNQAQRTLQVTGIAGLKDIKAQEDKTALEIEKNTKNNLKQSLNRLGIVPDWTLFETSEAYRAELNTQAVQKQASLDHYNATKQGFNLEELKTKSERGVFFQTEAPMQMTGFRDEFSLGVSTILNSQTDEATKLNQMDGLITSSRDIMARYFETKGVISEPEAKAMMDQFDIFAKGTVDQIRSAKTQADKLSIVQNQVKLQELLSDLKMNDQLDSATRKLIASMPADWITKIAFDNPIIGKNYVQALVSVVDDGLKNNSSIMKLVKTEGSLVPDIADAAATMQQLISTKQFDMLDKVIDAYHETQTSGRMTTVDHLNNMDDFFNLASRPGNIEQMSEISDVSKRKFFKVTTNYMTMLGNSFNSFINSTREFRTSDFTVDILPNGGILFNSPNAELENKLNDVYADRFNKIIKVTAPMEGITQKQSFERHRAFFEDTFKIGQGRETAAPGTFKEFKINIEPRFNQIIEQQAKAFDIDPNLIRSIIMQESSGNPNAIGPETRVGRAVGFMGLMPAAADEMEVDRNNPAENIVGGIKYFKKQLDRFGNVEKALAAYNAGPQTVVKAGGIPDFKETKNYVKEVLGRLERLND